MRQAASAAPLAPPQILATVAAMSGRFLIRFGIILGLFALAACTTAAVAPEAGGDAALLSEGALSAGKSSWSCDNGEVFLVDNAVTQISVTSPDGQAMVMPATPADSRTRYVVQQNAFVVDGDEALFFRPRATPLTCKKGPASDFRVVAAPSIDLNAQPAPSGD